MLNTGQRLLQWWKEGDTGVASFKSSFMSTSMELLLPYYGMSVTRAEEGFAFHHSQCKGVVCNARAARCKTCASAHNTRAEIKTMYQPAAVGPAVVRAWIDPRRR